MTRAKTLWAVVLVTALFGVTMIAAALQGSAQFRPLEASTESPPVIDEPQPTEPAFSPSPPPIVEPNPWGPIIGLVLLILLILLTAAGVIALLVVVIRRLLAMWRDRPLRYQDVDAAFSIPDAPTVAPEPEVEAAVIQRGIAGALREIVIRPEPGDAIVTAWVGLEESAADAGIVRGVSETPGEFALRIISRRSEIAHEAAALLRLYERVRFGGYVAEEADRETARQALLRIEEGWR